MNLTWKSPLKHNLINLGFSRKKYQKLLVQFGWLDKKEVLINFDCKHNLKSQIWALLDYQKHFLVVSFWNLFFAFVPVAGVWETWIYMPATFWSNVFVQSSKLDQKFWHFFRETPKSIRLYFRGDFQVKFMSPLP